jgi:hypothetical protein
MRQYQIITQHGKIYVQHRDGREDMFGSDWGKWVTDTTSYFDRDFCETFTYPRTFFWKWTARFYIHRQIAYDKKSRVRDELRVLGGPYQ